MTKELTPEHIQHNWGNLMRIIDMHFSGERLEKLKTMYDYFEERMWMAPASGKEHFHNAHAGGYVEHVIHVQRPQSNQFRNCDANVSRQVSSGLWDPSNSSKIILREAFLSIDSDVSPHYRNRLQKSQYCQQQCRFTAPIWSD